MKILKPEYEHSDSRRKLTQLITDDIKQVNVYHANRGAVLGNHYHKRTVEYFVITKGTFIVTIDTANGRVKFPANKGISFVVFPNERHSLRVLSPTAAMLTFLTRAYSPKSPDIFK